ncbi:MAG: outer membrane beta-barrel protein [Alloalcanivorax sp.]
MNKKITTLAFATLMGATGQHAFADAPSFNYVQFDYVVSGDSEIKQDGFPSESLDLQQGFGLQGGFEIGDYVMVMGRHMSLDYKDDEIGFGLAENTALNDMTFIGVGAHFPLADIVDLYGAVGFSRPTLISAAGEGYGLEFGARANFEMVTASLWYNMGDTDTKESFGSDTLDIDPELLGLDVAIAFAPDAPELVLGYVDATHEVKIADDKLDVDYDHFSIGVRKSF